jgi:hypothetical protein
VRRAEIVVGEETFRVHLRKEGLEIVPDTTPEEWVNRLVHALTVAAEGDVDQRAKLSRTGWAWR